MKEAQRRQRPTRRKPQRRDARNVWQRSAHPYNVQTYDVNRTSRGDNHITLPGIVGPLVIVAAIVAFVALLGASYQAGYQLGAEWAAS